MSYQDFEWMVCTKQVVEFESCYRGLMTMSNATQISQLNFVVSLIQLMALSDTDFTRASNQL